MNNFKKFKLGLAFSAVAFSLNALAFDEIPNLKLLKEGREKHAIEYSLRVPSDVNKIVTLDEKGVTSDVIYAIENNKVDYLINVVPYIKNINERFKYRNINGYTLAMVLAENANIDRKQEVINLFKEAGANFSISLNNGHNAFNIAKTHNNYFFKEMVNNEGKKLSYDKMYFTNEKLSTADTYVQEKIIQNLNSGLLDELNKDQQEKVNVFIELIRKGYNDAADILLESGIEIDETNERGITPLVASAISSLDGGNVEYAKKLIDLGADVNYKSKETNNVTLTSFASIRDNYKVLVLLILSGSNFMEYDLMGLSAMDYAVSNESERSAIIILNSLDAALKSVGKK